MDKYFLAIDIKKHLPALKNTYFEEIESALSKCNVQFYYTEKVKTPFWVRLTLPFAFMVMILFLILMPLSYVITGHWGYKHEWLTNWLRSLGF